MYDAVAAAQAAAIAAVGPGARVADVDARRADVLVAPGSARPSGTARATAWGSKCTRRRGLGARGRRVGATACPGTCPMPDEPRAGMVVTIEPGAYVPGFGGVRIEDDVLVTGDGREVLTTVDATARVLD